MKIAPPYKAVLFINITLEFCAKTTEEDDK